MNTETITETLPLGPNTRATYVRHRVRDEIWLLHQHRVITDAHWIAAERMRDDMVTAAGRIRGQPFQRVNSTPSSGGSTGAMLDAARRVDGAWRAVRPDSRLVFWCLHGGSLQAWECLWHKRHGSAAPVLTAALDRLAAYYSEVRG